jgi:hypothetical protein
MWTVYVALEPYVRRFWPDGLLGWARLISGHIRDPRVGRDVLVGMLFGVGLLFVELAKVFVIPKLGYGAPFPVYGSAVEALAGPGTQITACIEVLFQTLALALFIVLGLVVLRFVLRGWALVGAGAIMISVLFMSTLGGTTRLVFVFPVISGVLATIVAVRFGLLTLLTGLIIYFVGVLPFTLDMSHWLAPTSMVTVSGLLALAAFAFYASRAGQPLFGMFGRFEPGT